MTSLDLSDLKVKDLRPNLKPLPEGFKPSGR